MHGLDSLIYNDIREQKAVLGEIEDINQITMDHLKLCYDYYYNPANMYLIVCGKFDPKKIIKLVRENQSRKTFPEFKEIVDKEFLYQDDLVNNYFEKEMNVNIPLVNISYKINYDKFNDLRLDIGLLSLYIMIIQFCAFGVTSQAIEDFDDKKIIPFGMSNIKYLIRGKHMVIGLTAKTDKVNKFLESVRKTILNYHLSKEDFERKKKIRISSFILVYESISTINNSFENDLMYFGKPIDNYLDILKSLDYQIALKILNIIQANLKYEAVVKIVPYNKNKQKE